MQDETVFTASSLEEIAKSPGLKSYLWIYFLIVPLAASTASTVAIVIAALQGLASHQTASQIYALVVMSGTKAILIIGGAYMLGLMSALFIAWLYRQSEYRTKARIAMVAHMGPEQKARFTQQLADYLEARSKRAQLFVGAAIINSSLLIVAASMFFLREDVAKLWSLLRTTAYPSSS